MLGMQWVAPGFNTANGAYVIPLEDQFYIGFYNKSLFTKAGITQVPQNWTQLMTDCAAFKAMGTNCLYYGADTQALGAEFYPYYDLSYLMIGALGVSQWEELYNGQLSWTDPIVEAQLTKWAALHADGYTNSNVISSGELADRAREGSDRHDRGRQLGHRRPLPVDGQQPGNLRAALLGHVDQWRGPVPGRRVLDDHLLAAQDPGGRVPPVPHHHPGGDHHRPERPDPGPAAGRRRRTRSTRTC